MPLFSSDHGTARPIHPAAILLAISFLALPLIQISRLFDSVALPRHILLSVAGSLALLIYLKPWTAKSANLQWHPVLSVLVIFLLLIVMSMVWSIDEANTAVSITHITPMLMVFFVLSQIKPGKNFEVVLAAVLSSSAIAAVIGIQQHFNFNPLGLYQVKSPASTFLNRNIAAQFFSAAIPLTAFMVLYTQNKTLKFFYATSLGLAITFVIIAKTRGTLLALTAALLSLLVAIIFSQNTKSAVLNALKGSAAPLLYGFVIIITMVSLPSTSEHGKRWKVGQLYSAKMDRSVESRLTTYKNTLAMIQSRPLLGVGYNAYARGFRPFAAKPYSNPIINEVVSFRFAHNAPLQYFAELGIVGGLVPIAAFILILVVGFRTLFRLVDSDSVLILLGLLLSVIATLAHAMVSFPLRMPTSAAVFWACSGMILAFAFQQAGIRTSRMALGRTLKGAASGFTVAFLGFALYLLIPFAQGQHHLMAAHLFHTNEQCEKAKVAIDRAYGLIPWDLSVISRFVQIYTFCPISNYERFEAMDSVLSHDPTNPLAYLTRAQLYLAANKTAAAAKDFYKVIDLVPHRVSGYIGLAQIAEQQGEIQNAKEFLEIAAQLDPQNQEIQTALDELRH